MMYNVINKMQVIGFWTSSGSVYDFILIFLCDCFWHMAICIQSNVQLHIVMIIVVAVVEVIVIFLNQLKNHGCEGEFEK